MMMPALSVTFIGLMVALTVVGARAVRRRRPAVPFSGRWLVVAVGAVAGAWAGFVAGALAGVVLDVTTGSGMFVALLGHAVALPYAVAGAHHVLDAAPRRV